MSFPQEAITAAAGAIWDEHINGPVPLDKAQWCNLLARRALQAAAPLIEAAERRRIYDQLGHDHFVIFAEDGWTVEHSVDCRLAGDVTTGCAYWVALKYAGVTDAVDPEMLGRWRIDGIDSEGLPSLSRAELIREEP